MGSGGQSESQQALAQSSSAESDNASTENTSSLSSSGSSSLSSSPSRRHTVTYSTEARQDGLKHPKTLLSSLRWWVGLVQASVFSLIYLFAPGYILSSVFLLLWYQVYQAPFWLVCYISPILVSAVLPPVAVPWLIASLKPMLEYFDSYEQILEVESEELEKTGQNYILACQPHGVISYTGICSAIAAPKEYQGTLPTAVADAVLWCPILKHVMGIFGLMSASKKSLVKRLQSKGVDGTVVLYVGGMAELFLSCQNEERLYLKKRKGFIKLSLQTGVDIIPVYLFGNTSVLSVMKHGVLSTLSRKLQVSLTYMWGKWYLPIPRNDCKLLYVSGRPIGIPHIPNPTQADIDRYHDLYCQQVERLYREYRERVPEYKHKKLILM